MCEREAADAFVHQVVRDWRAASLGEVDRALCSFAEKLTLDQRSQEPGDLDDLRRYGLDDRAIHDLVQVVAYFAYITRVADGLGVEPEEFIETWGD
ncbi:MAG: peroxidase [Planctomycetota bacterium]